jgi:catechol 2,3-dioxygenase-like lactoylglutathione lyase family enzyme
VKLSPHAKDSALAMTISENPVVAFLATRDAARARAFYEGMLGLRVVDDTPFALVFDAKGTQLRIQKVDAFTPHPFTSLGWKVSDIGAAIGELRTRGIVFERYDFLPADSSGAWTSPDGAKVAWFKDPDGNTLSITEDAILAPTGGA